jgi:hypothetical protein
LKGIGLGFPGIERSRVRGSGIERNRVRGSRYLKE